jgi:hypothetical protein
MTGDPISFEHLVRCCLGDIPAGAIRVELLKYGAIAVEPTGRLVARRREVVPDAFDEKLITSMSFNLRALASTIAFNSNPSRVGSGRIERFVQSTSLGPQAKSTLRTVLRQRIIAFTEEIDDLFSGRRGGEPDDRGRVGLGVYYYEDDV